jgi:hypothetical protein
MMGCEAVLTHVLALLQQEQRVAYRAQAPVTAR